MKTTVNLKMPTFIATLLLLVVNTLAGGGIEVQKFDFFETFPDAGSCFKVTFEGPDAVDDIFYNRAFAFAVREDKTGFIRINGELKAVVFQKERQYRDHKNRKHLVKTFEKDGLRVLVDTFVTKQHELSKDISGTLSVLYQGQMKDYKVVGYSGGDGPHDCATF